MDNHVHQELAFSVHFPLPFRVLFLGCLGVLGWATNLHGLAALGIDAASALELSTYQSNRLTAHGRTNSEAHTPLPTATTASARAGWKLVAHPSALYAPVYRLFAYATAVTAIGWACYQHAIRGDEELVDVFKFIPGVVLLCVLMILVCPFEIFEKKERDKFLHAVRRCMFAQNRIHFSDVVCADIFTSFAKVLGDVWLSICMILPGGSLLYPPPQEGLSRWILPTLMSVPYAIRLRQCLVEYNFPTNESKRPLYNAIKYASSFPVIFLSAAQRHVAQDTESIGSDGGWWYNRHPLFNLWLLAALINSLYSFWWDITFDWGFDLLRLREKKPSLSRAQSPPRPLMLPRLHSRSALLASPDLEFASKESLDELDGAAYSPRSGKRYPYGLRSMLLFPLPMYPFAILVDLILRLTWSAKLSSHLHAFVDEDRAIFFIEFLEMFRRWMWVFLRVEWEVVRERQVRAAVPPGTRIQRRAPDASTEQEYELLGRPESRASLDGADATAEWRDSPLRQEP